MSQIRNKLCNPGVHLVFPKMKKNEYEEFFIIIIGKKFRHGGVKMMMIQIKSKQIFESHNVESMRFIKRGLFFPWLKNLLKSQWLLWS